MKKLFLSVLLLFLSAVSIQAQITVTQYDKIIKIRNNNIPSGFPKLSCDSIYQLLTNYTRDNEVFIRGKGLKALVNLYRSSKEGDSCLAIRLQIAKDFLGYIQRDSLSNTEESTLTNALYTVFPIEDIKNLGGRSIFLSMYQKKGLSAPAVGGFVSPFKMVEVLPDLWKKFNQIKEDNSNKASVLYEIVDLGDLNGINVYKKTLWDYTKDTKKIIHEQYFYDLLSNIRYLKDEELARELFEILEYLADNPDKDKKIYMYLLSDDPNPIYWFLGQAIYYKCLPRTVANLPEEFYKYPYPEYTKENVEKLLNWYKQNSKLILK